MRIKPNKNPFYPFRQLKLSGDKSISHRVLMLAAISNGKSVLKNISLCDDCLSTIDCLRALGAQVLLKGTTATVYPIVVAKDNVVLNCGNSGTTARLLAGIVAGLGITATFTGDESLKLRPMNMLDYLAQMGAKYTKPQDCLFRIHPSKLTGKEITVTDGSAQTKSAVLLAALFADGVSAVTEPTATRDHTERAIAFFGGNVTRKFQRTQVTKSTLMGVNAYIPNDASTAAYYITIGAFCRGVTLKKVLVNGSRLGYLRTLKEMGAKLSFSHIKSNGFEEYASISVKRSVLKPLNELSEPLGALIDEIPLLALALCLSNGGFAMEGLAALKGKESNRIISTAKLLNAVGFDAVADGDTLYGNGGSLKGGIVDSCGDHRIAMCAVTAGVLSTSGVEVDTDCIAVSAPHFLSNLRLK